MVTKKFFFPYGSFSVKDGSEIRFWEDTWLGTTPLREQYPALYGIVQGRHKSDTLAQVLVDIQPTVTFRIDLVGSRLASWYELLLWLATINLTQGTDEFRWNLRNCGKFSVDSIYIALVQPDVPVENNKKIWKMKIPLKNKVFAWYLCRAVILTKDNFAKRNWYESKQCVFCHKNEIQTFVLLV